MLQPMTARANYKIATTTTSGSTTVAGDTNQIRFFNEGSVVVFYRTGATGATVTAVIDGAPDTWIEPGVEVVFSKPPQDTVLALIAASGTAQVRVTVGEGA